VIAHVPAGEQADIDLAVTAARRAFETGPWSRISPAARQPLVWSLGDLIERHAGELAELAALDNGKPVTNARRDSIGGSIEMFRYMAGWTTCLNGEQILVSSPGDWHGYSIREPVGVVSQIIPWNFPLMMAAWKLAPTPAAGCTIVLKPAEQTPRAASAHVDMESAIAGAANAIFYNQGQCCTTGSRLFAHKSKQQDGSEIRSVELERLTAEGRTITERRNAMEFLRDEAVAHCERQTHAPWRPRSGSKVSHKHLTAAMIDSRDFIAARKRAERETLLPV
jgi:acyl-CoA reductase-like NAD-dependent aldehyde dehydrogenase